MHAIGTILNNVAKNQGAAVPPRRAFSCCWDELLMYRAFAACADPYPVPVTVCIPP